MLLIEQLLSTDELSQIHHALKQGQWQSGAQTAGSLSASVKQNLQLPEDAVTREVAEQLRRRISQHPQFISVALAKHITRPRFNAYKEGGHYGMHIDSAIMRLDDTAELMRCDLSYTVFLQDPSRYEGGELCIQDHLGTHRIKAPAGAMVVYPASSWHEVLPVTQGERLCAIGWVQSVVKSHDERLALYELDQAIQQLDMQSKPYAQMTAVYNNLLRRFSEI